MKFTIWIFILILFTGCIKEVPHETPQVGLQEIEGAFLEGKWDEVITLGEKQLAEEPDNAVIRFILAMAYYMKGEYELQEQQRSLALENEESMDVIIAWCENLSQRFPDNSYAHLLLGSAYRAKDEVDKALKSYRRAIEINPNFADAYLGLGVTYLENEQLDEAIHYIKKAIEINPAHLPSYLNLGFIYEYNGQIDEAIASFEKAIEMNPRFTGAYIKLGDLYLEKDDRDKAVKAYKKVIELEPESELGSYAEDAIEDIEDIKE